MKLLQTLTPSYVRQLLVYMGAAFLLNFFWESWHAFSLYAGHDGSGFSTFPVREYVSMITYVSFVDMFFITVVFAGGAILWRKKEWSHTMTSAKWLYFIGSLFTIAVIIEIKAIYVFHEWSYNELMPTLFGLGLSPLIQLSITGMIALLVSRHVQ